MMAGITAETDPLVADLLHVCGGNRSPGTVWIAFSGGLDSSVLLHAAAMARTAGLQAPMTAVHVDHGLHPDSGLWNSHCRMACSALDIEYRTLTVTVVPASGESLEACARNARYGALRPLLGEGDMLLAAHHRDDQAETVLQQLLRGAGVAGLAAMPPRAPFGAGELVRPWLMHAREALLAFARRHHVSWVDDPSNADVTFDRNHLRHELFPVIEARWPAAKRVFARSAAHCAEAAELLGTLGEVDLVALGEGACPGTLPIPALTALAPARQRNLLRTWLRLRELPVPSTAQMERLDADLLHAAEDRDPRVVWGGVEARRYRDRLYVMPVAADAHDFEPLSWDLRQPLALAGGVLTAVATEGQGLSRSRIDQGAVEVCSRRGGESMRPVGHKHQRTLKYLYQERGVPTWVRARTPLICIDGQLAAVAGLWLDSSFAAKADEPGWVVTWRENGCNELPDSIETMT